MGTTESAFFYEDSAEDASPSQSTHSGHAPAMPSSSATTPPVPHRKIPPRPAKQRPSAINRHLKLKGHILGLPGSGKRTLLARLQGKDPFDPSSPDDIAPVREGVQHTLPYQAPPDQPSWDRIQLLVHCAEDFVQTKEPLDFAVVLINPQDRRKKVKRYLVEHLQRLLHMLGYRTDGSEQMPLRPLSLCLLLNFRDLSLAKTHVEESNATMWTMEVLQDYPSLDPQQLVLQSGQTSLKNCYGLSLLHQFIYQSYLHRRQYQLETDLLQVRTTQQQAKEAAPPVQDYDDFLAILDGKAPSPPPKKQEKKKKAVSPGDLAGRRKFMPTKHRQAEPQATRPATPPPEEPPAKTNALEAFLASSDEENEKDEKRKTTRVKSAARESDRDDDDDFVVTQVQEEAPEPNESNDIQQTTPAKEASKGTDNEESPTRRVEQSRKSPASTADSSDASVASRGSAAAPNDGQKKEGTSMGDSANKTEMNGDNEKRASPTAAESDENDHESPGESETKSSSLNKEKAPPGDVESHSSAEEIGKSPVASGYSRDDDDAASHVQEGHTHDLDEEGSAEESAVDAVESSADVSPDKPAETQNDDSDVDNPSSGREAPLAANVRLSDKTYQASVAASVSSRAEKSNGEDSPTQESKMVADSDDVDQSGSALVGYANLASSDDDREREQETHSSDDNDRDSPEAGEPEPASSALSETGKSTSQMAFKEDSSDDEEFFVSEPGPAAEKIASDDESQKAVDAGSVNEKTAEHGRPDDKRIATDANQRHDGQFAKTSESVKTSGSNESDDDDESVMEEPSAKTSDSVANASPPAAPSSTTELDLATVASKESPSGLSDAARAAIVAAQEDFESMLQPSGDGSDTHKKKKKKKDKEGKEKKKDKKKKKGSAENIST